jgi:RNA polymerase sigma factor (sigma-70 family)
MATSRKSEVIQHLHGAGPLPCGAGSPDGQLLTDYLSRRDEAALAALVRRHGPMVWGVCRRVLRNYHDVEDAFQATFLVLVRKAASIASRELLANWLYGVAYQTALNARATAARRGARERQVTKMPEPEATPQGLWQDLQPLLDQELSRLPDKYRVPIVLCDLEGKTRKEAARQIGCPEGTVAGRLARARALLAKRLARHGLAATAGTLAAGLAQGAASACVPAAVVSSTIKAATLAVAGPAAAAGAVSARVAALTEGVLKTMLLSKLKIAGAVLAVVAILVAGVSLVRLPVLAGEPPQSARADKPAAQKGDKPPGAPGPVVVRDDTFIRQLAWSADGAIVATVGETYDEVEVRDSSGNNPKKVRFPTSTLKLWDAGTGNLRRALEEEKHTAIRALAFSPDKETVAIVTRTGSTSLEAGKRDKLEVKLMDAKTWALKYKVEDSSLAEVFGWSAVAFSPDGKKLALGGNQGGYCVQLWDVQNKKVLGGTALRKKALTVADLTQAMQNPDLGTAVACLAFSPDGGVLAAGDVKDKIRLFDGRTGEPRGVLDGHQGRVTGVAFAPDGKTLVSGSDDRTVKVWDVAARKVLRTLKGNKGPVRAVAGSPDGALVATGGNERGSYQAEVILWDSRTGEMKQSLTDLNVWLLTLAFSPDGRTLAVGGFQEGGKASELRLIPVSQ